MSDTDFLNELTREIMAQGFDEATASDYAVLIGDTPCLDERGHVVVSDGNRVVVRLLPLKMFTS